MTAEQLSAVRAVLREVPVIAIEDQAPAHELDVEAGTPLGDFNRNRFVNHIALLQRRLDDAQNTIARWQREDMERKAS